MQENEIHGNESEVVRIEVEREDGSIVILRGRAAEEYTKQVVECFKIAAKNGTEIKEFDWFETNKYPAP